MGHPLACACPDSRNTTPRRAGSVWSVRLSEAPGLTGPCQQLSIQPFHPRPSLRFGGTEARRSVPSIIDDDAVAAASPATGRARFWNPPGRLMRDVGTALLSAGIFSAWGQFTSTTSGGVAKCPCHLAPSHRGSAPLLMRAAPRRTRRRRRARPPDRRCAHNAGAVRRWQAKVPTPRAGEASALRM